MNRNTLTDDRKPLSQTLSQHLLSQKLDIVMLPAIEKKRCLLTRKGDVFEKKFVNTIMTNQTTKNGNFSNLSTGIISKPLLRSISKPESTFNCVSTQAKVRYIDDMGLKLKNLNTTTTVEKKEIKKN